MGRRSRHVAESVDSTYQDGMHPTTSSEAIGEVEAETQRTSGQILGTRNVWVMGAAILALALLAVAFGATFRTLWRTWLNNENYSHGILILPVSLFMVWTARRDLAKLPARSTWLGLPFLIAGVGLHLVGTRGDVTIFQGWGFVAIVAGLVWTWLGTRIAWRLSFPILFLLFMVPALPIFMNQVSFRLKEVAANGSVHLAQILGAPVVQRGMDLYFPSGTLTVENACSGMNSLIALMALGALFAYFGAGPYWRRGLLFLASIPIAIAANVARITSLCVAASVTDTDSASGLFHDIGGFVLFGVALLLLFAAKRLLRC